MKENSDKKKKSSNKFELTAPNHPITEAITNAKICQKNFDEIDCDFTPWLF